MKTYLSIIFVLSYFLVFIIGLLASFHVTRGYYKTRKFIKASSIATLALCAIGGLIQAIIGV